MADFEDRFFTNPDGLKQHYRDYNSAGPNAPVVLCMPGLTRNPKDFADIADHLADRCRVICIANRGRGLSDYDPEPRRYMPLVYVADVIELLKQLGIKEIIAIGTSLGGLMTILMGAMHPGVLQAAVINDIGPEVDPKGIARIKSYVGKGTPPQTWDEVLAGVKRANDGVYPNFSEADWDWYARNLYEIKDGKLVVQYDPLISQNFEAAGDQAAPDLWPVFKALHSIPMVVLRGELSDILAADVLDRMAHEHPDLVPVTVAGLGHVPLMREPECKAAIDKLVARFI